MSLAWHAAHMSLRLADNWPNPNSTICCKRATQSHVPADNPGTIQALSSSPPTFASDLSRIRQPASHSGITYHLSASPDISIALLHSPTSHVNLLTQEKSHLYPRSRAILFLPSCKNYQADCSSDLPLKCNKYGLNVSLTSLFFSFRAILIDLVMGSNDTSY